MRGIKVIATHNGRFHADDVFGVATLMLLFSDVEVVRTRDEKILASADLRLDVGGRYCFETRDFDHHQIKGAGVRVNGLPYASFGLIWKHFGEQLTGSRDVFRYVEDKLVQVIDAGDNGVLVYVPKSHFLPYTISDVIDVFNPRWDEASPDFDSAFLRAVDFAKSVIGREILLGQGKVDARVEVREALCNAGDILVLDRYCPWQDVVIKESEVKFVVFPATSGDWGAQAVPLKRGSFQVRKSFPDSWAGLSGEEFEKVSGVRGAVFCHRALFVVFAKSKEAVVELAKKALMT